MQVNWENEQLRMNAYVSSLENGFNTYINSAIVKMNQVKGQMSAVTGQCRDLYQAYSESEMEAAAMQSASRNHIYQLQCFVEQEVNFKKEAIIQYHILNEASTADKETLARDLENSHSQIMYQTDLATRRDLALKDSEMSCSKLMEKGRLQFREFEQMSTLMAEENTTMQKQSSRVEQALKSECANALTLSQQNALLDGSQLRRWLQHLRHLIYPVSHTALHKLAASASLHAQRLSARGPNNVRCYTLQYR